MVKEEKKQNFVPLDWKPSVPNPPNFQIPSREKKLVPITKPSDSEKSTLHSYPRETQRQATPSKDSQGEGTYVRSYAIENTKQNEIVRGQVASPSARSSVNAETILSRLPSSNEQKSGPKTSLAMQTQSDFRIGTYDASPTENPAILASLGKVQQWRPDVYVQTFVPQSLKAINDAPALLRTTRPVDGINFTQYVSTFAGTQFLSALDKTSDLSFDGESPVDSLDRLLPQNYGQYFGDSLILDFEAQKRMLRSYDLFGVALELRDHEKQTYLLKVTGLREGTPNVNFGDFVMLRQLVLDSGTRLPRGMDLWLGPGMGRDRGAPCPGFTGLQQRAVVVGIDKSVEAVILMVDGLILPGTPVCNVSFVVQDSLVQSMQRAVADIHQELGRRYGLAGSSKNSKEACKKHMDDHDLFINEGVTETKTSGGATDSRSTEIQLQPPAPQPSSTEALSENSSPINWLHAVLFPSETNGIQQNTLPSIRFSQTWFDRNLNYEQKVEASPF